MSFQFSFQLEVQEGDILKFPADVLMTKQAAASGGVDAVIQRTLKDSGVQVPKLEVGAYFLTPYHGKAIQAAQVLVVGTLSVFQLRYEGLRRLGYDMLAALKRENVSAKHLSTTLHGINTAAGNDEEEAFRALLVGFTEAVMAGETPNGLEKITLVEWNIARAHLMRETLARWLKQETPPLPAARALPPQAAPASANVQTAEAFLHPELSKALPPELLKPVANEAAPHIFVAMPFADRFDDHFYLAIQPAVKQADFLCIRLDQSDSAFTGDIVEEVKRRIETARLVVALLDERNPNVYLEVGYAWGVGTPALLILHEDEQAPFDVQGARLVRYKRLHLLKEQLSAEIRLLTR